MNNRRTFLKNSALVSAAALVSSIDACKPKETTNDKQQMTNPLPAGKKPMVISTWEHGLAANDAAWKVLSSGGRALDAVEQGVRVSESDPKCTSVGYGGLPDRDGNVTLDACIMDEIGNCGSVAFLEHIMNPISVARVVMEKTKHCMLVGEGALQFALANGFKKENLLTPEAKAEWEKWLKENKYTPMKIDKNNHDTIGMLAIDSNGNLSGACTTSGLGWKLRGRVGDSPIIGAGLFVDNEVGAATATGRGESVIKICGTHTIVELMRAGKTPTEACKIAIERIVRKQSDSKEFQVGFLATDKDGRVGGFSLQPSFQYAYFVDGENKMVNAESYYEGEKQGVPR